MDKFTKSLISVSVILVVLITIFIFFGGYAYEIKGILKGIGVNSSDYSKIQTEDGVNFGPYMDEMQSIMKKNWTPPDKSKSAIIETSYKVSKNGEISDIKIVKSDASEENNKAVIETLNKVSPLPPLPLGYKEDSIMINFTFAINSIKK